MNRTILVITGLFFALIAAGIIMESSSHNHYVHVPPETGCHGNCTITYITRIVLDPDAEPIPTYKKMLKADNKEMREMAEKALRQLGVPEAEIEDAKKK